MKHSLSKNEKLLVVYRVEPGCLGPEGGRYIVEFCDVAQAVFRSLDSDYVIWDIIPRHDKSLPEIQYSLAGKTLTNEQAEKYLTLCGQVLDNIEGDMGDKLETLITRYMNHVNE